MRLVSFGPLGEERAGVLTPDGRQIVDLNAAESALPSTMLELLRGNFLERVKRILADISSIPAKALKPATGARLGAPVPRPGQIICIGLNYRDHADESGLEYPKSPLLFGKSPTAVVGPNDDVVYPEGVEQLDYEVELGVVIGRAAKKVPAAEARKHIAGFCVFHDVSARCACG